MSGSARNLPDSIATMNAQELHRLVADLSVREMLAIWPELSEKATTTLFVLLDIDRKAKLITELAPPEREHLITNLPLDNAREIFETIAPDDLVDIVQDADPDVRDRVWSSLSLEARSQIQFLLRFDEDDAAGIMTTRYAAIRSDRSVGQALTFIRERARNVETIYYVYIVDNVKRLQGVVSLRDLLFADDARPVGEIMTERVVSVLDSTDQEEVAKLLEAHDLIALPVVDDHGRMLGIVTFDDAIDVIREEQTEDVYRMGAMDGAADRYVDSNVWRLVRKRIPWLIVLLVAGTLTTNVLAGFQPLIAAAGFLVWFVPVITQTGGNSGTQSSTLMIRGIATGDIRVRDLWLVLSREIAVGLIMGVVLAAVIMLRSTLVPPGVAPIEAIAIGVALVFVVLFSSVVGAMAPLVIHALGLDPTLMAAPLMSTVIDVVGLTIYFSAARYILGL